MIGLTQQSLMPKSNDNQRFCYTKTDRMNIMGSPIYQKKQDPKNNRNGITLNSLNPPP